MIKKILVANRGEIAMRIFRTCRVMNIATAVSYTHLEALQLIIFYIELMVLTLTAILLTGGNG